MEEREAQNVVYRRQVSFAVKASVSINLLLFFVKGAAWYISNSYAIVSSLVDSTVDLVNQLVLFFAERRMAIPSERFPAGKTRLEPVAIIIGAVLMCTLSFNVRYHPSRFTYNYESCSSHLNGDAYGFRGPVQWLRRPWQAGAGGDDLDAELRHVSGTALALAEDHRNDVLSNLAAITTSSIAGAYSNLWYIDPIGAVMISLYIIWCWVTIGNEQVNYVVGEKADDELHEEINNLANSHHENLEVDQLRVYHIGRHYLVELEVIMPADTSLRVVHDVSLDLQNKIEQVPGIERAFVHVDYESRNYLEHKEPRLL
eukprot:124861-Prorocentrum_minimum.AAC.1